MSNRRRKEEERRRAEEGAIQPREPILPLDALKDKPPGTNHAELEVRADNFHSYSSCPTAGGGVRVVRASSN